MKGGGGVQNCIESAKNVVEGTFLETNHGQPHRPTAKEMNRAHLGDILYDDELKFVTVFAEELPEVAPL